MCLIVSLSLKYLIWSGCVMWCIFGLIVVGYIWLLCWICIYVVLWVGLWYWLCLYSWCVMCWVWLFWFVNWYWVYWFIWIGVVNMLVLNIGNYLKIMVWYLVWVVRVIVGIMLWWSGFFWIWKWSVFGRFGMLII